MSLYQVVEKESFGTDWHPVRYSSSNKALTRFASEEEAYAFAKEYLTDTNCNNSLTKDEKLTNTETFMMTPEGCYLGVLDGKPWYMTYPKDIKDTKNHDKIAHIKGDPVHDKKFFMLEGKTEVAVRILPGT